MKIIDREKRRILGLNPVDLLALVVVLILSAYVLSGYLFPQEIRMTYSGLDIERAVMDFKRLASLGFVVRAKVSGRWIGNGSPFSGDLLISAVSSSSLYGWLNGSPLMIGGSNAYLEDVAADSIEFYTVSPSVIFVPLRGVFEEDSISGLSERMLSLAEEVAGGYGVAALKIRFSNLAVVVPGLRSNAVDFIEINSRVRERIPYPCTVYVYDNYLLVRTPSAMEALRPEDLSELEAILAELGIEYEEVLADGVILYIGTEESLSRPGAYGEILKNARRLGEIVDTQRLYLVPKV